MARTRTPPTSARLLDQPPKGFVEAGARSPASSSDSLRELEVLVIDCQATAAAPDGHLLEIGWARVHKTTGEIHARLIALPDDCRIPRAVTRITGITESLSRSGIDARAAWLELARDAAIVGQPLAPAVIHFARFERPFIDTFVRSCIGDHPTSHPHSALPPGGAPDAPTLALDVICTHEIARRLLPNLPRRSLRALTGYFGGGVGQLRRSSDHVQATALVWREVVSLLADEGITSWRALREWLMAPVARTRSTRRIFPLPREIRLAVPAVPGVYRLLRTSGDVVYVGKAASLRDRVNSYFRQQSGIGERMLEMLSQVRAISFEVTPTALEAALLEPMEIKRHRPPYNIALMEDDGRRLWCAPGDLSARSSRFSHHCVLGPFPSGDVLDRFGALARIDRAAVAHGRSAPDERVFAEGWTRLCHDHCELRAETVDMPRRLLGLGTRLWREGLRDRRAKDDEHAAPAPPEQWTPELVERALELIALRAAHARRRATWLLRLVDAAIVWREPGDERMRLLTVNGGEIDACDTTDPTPPAPKGHRRLVPARHERMTLARFDRLRVLTTELKRLNANDAYAAVRFGENPPFSGARLTQALWWL